MHSLPKKETESTQALIHRLADSVTERNFKAGKITAAEREERLSRSQDAYMASHKAPDKVLNDPIRAQKDGVITKHNNPNTSFLGHDIKYRHDVDRVLANLRHWDKNNPTKSLKMKWLQEVFPHKSPEEIYDLSSKTKGSLYAGVTRLARDENPRKSVDLKKADLDYSLHNLGEGKKSASIVQEMKARVEDSLRRFGFKGKIVVDNRENFPPETAHAHPDAEGFMTDDGTLYVDAAKNNSHADAIFTAFHEAYHRGELGSEAKPYADALERAGRNGTVRSIADRIKQTYKDHGIDLQDSRAVREALAEVHAAQKTGSWDKIRERNGNGIDPSPLAKAQAHGVVRKVIESLKAVFTKAFKRPMTDHEINELVNNTFKKASGPIKTSSREIDHSLGLRKADLASPKFKEWFGKSKVAGEDGKPIQVYHGTGERFTVFDKSKPSVNEHSTSPLGHFFTPDRDLALKYADRASEGRPADRVMVPAYLRIEKPYEMSLAEAQNIEGPDEARALRAKLEAEGHDGVHITSKDGDSWVAFKSEQIKSPYNKGEFSSENPDIMHSLGNKEKKIEGDNSGVLLKARNERLAQSLKDGKISKAQHDRLVKLGEEKFGEKAPAYQDLNEPLGKIARTARAWSYFSMLTSLRTIPRILSTSISEAAIRPIEEMLGVINSKIAPNIAALAPRYGGGISGSAEAKAFNAIFAGKEYGEMLKTGRTSLDRGIGDILEKYKGKIPKEEFEKIQELANNWKMMSSAHTGLLALPGRVHGFLHTMPMLAEYARSINKRTAFSVKQLTKDGMSPKDAAQAVLNPVSQVDIQIGAYSDALSAAYRGETTVGKYYDKGIKALRDGNGVANAFASLLQIANPFVKVSANLFSRATSFLAGGAKAGLEYGLAKKRGFMTPEQADYIIKNMNAQGIGLGAMLLGSIFYDQMGGLYDSKTYGRTDRPKEGSIKIGDTEIPSHLLEHPMIQLAQLGAMTTRGIFEHRGVEAAAAGAEDLANIASVIRSSGDVSKAVQGGSKGIIKYVAEMATSRLIPAPIRDIAAIQDYMENSPKQPDAVEALVDYMFLGEKIGRRVKTGEDVLKKQLPKTDLNPDFNVQSLQRSN